MDFSKEIRQKNNNEQERWKINCLVHANSEDSDLHVRMYIRTCRSDSSPFPLAFFKSSKFDKNLRILLMLCVQKICFKLSVAGNCL